MICNKNQILYGNFVKYVVSLLVFIKTLLKKFILDPRTLYMTKKTIRLQLMLPETPTDSI